MSLTATVLTAATLLVGCDRSPVGKVLDKNKYSVTVPGEGSSTFSDEYERAAQLIAQHKVEEAERLYEELAKKEPNSANPYVGLGSCRLNYGDFPGARGFFKQALEKQPNSVNAFVGLGSSYTAEYDFSNALSNYERAGNLNDSCPEAHYGLAKTYTYLSNKTLARLHFNRYRQLFLNSPYLVALEDFVEHHVGTPTNSPLVR